MASEAVGWDMYDPRLTTKVQLAPDEACDLGDCVYVHTDGLGYLSDNGEDKCHGCALDAQPGSAWVTLVRNGRLRMVTAQVPGANVMSNATSGGGPPDDDGGGPIVGYAAETYLIIVQIDSTSTT